MPAETHPEWKFFEPPAKKPEGQSDMQGVGSDLTSGLSTGIGVAAGLVLGAWILSKLRE